MNTVDLPEDRRPPAEQKDLPPVDLMRVREETFVLTTDFHWRIASTNTRAAELAEAAEEIPLLVLAAEQTAGRGRGENRWWSAPGALTASVILDLSQIADEHLPKLSLTAGLAICQAIESIVPAADLAVKWPNDIFLEQRKLAGVLIEVPKTKRRRAILGFGVNVNNALHAAPQELQRTATSLVDLLGAPLSVQDVLVRILQELERRWNQLQSSPESLVDQWQAYHLLRNRRVEVDVYGKRVRGRAREIDRQGALVVETPEGAERLLGGVVTHWQ